MKNGIPARFKRMLAGILCFFLLIVPLYSLPIAATNVELPDITRANAVYLYQCENQQILAQKNADVAIFPASTVKIMTGLVAVKMLQQRMSETVTVTQAMVDAASGFRMYLNPGEIVTIEQMLYAGICAGYNDACVVLAYLVSGSVEAFVTQMNLYADELGMESTTYTNPTGLHDPRMMTTVNDTARLALAAMENDIYMKIASSVKYTMSANNLASARTFYNRNYMIARNITSRYYNGYVTGLNAGTTTEGGYCVVASAEVEATGLHYLCIVMGADMDAEENGGTIHSYQIANALLNYAIHHFGMVQLFDTETVLATVEVALTERKTSLSLVPQESVTVYLPTALNPTQDLTWRVMMTGNSVKAPVRKGEILGFVTVSQGDTLIASANLCAADDVAQSAFLAGLDRISDYTTSRRFLLSCAYAAILLLTWFVGRPLWRKRKNRKRARYY